MKTKLNLFLKEFVLFGLTMSLGIASAYSNAPIIEKSIIDPGDFSLDSLVIFLAVFTIFLLVMTKFKRMNAIALRFFLLLVVFSGSQILIGSSVTPPWDLVGAFAVVLFFIFVRNVLVHNFGMILGIAGVSSLLGVTITPQAAIILLVILSFYDIFAVYVSKHMVHLAEGMIHSGAIFGFVIPFQLKDIFYHKEEARNKMGEKFMILGSGDIGLPLIMASSVAVVSLSQSIITALSSMVGLFITHLLFVNQGSKRPMAALPPIATLTIIGYLVAQILRF